MKVRIVRDPTVPGRRPYGLPAPLPTGERLLWQGAPTGRGVALRVLHLRALALYFAALLAICAVHAIGTDRPSAWFSLGALFVLGSVALGLLGLFAFLISRTTVYTITDRRVVMRTGIALPASLNLPYAQVEQASVRLFRDGTADVALLMVGEGRLGWTMLWPHVRPWRTRRVQPMLRCLPGGSQVGDLLGRYLRQSVEAERATDDVRAPARHAAMAAGD